MEREEQAQVVSDLMYQVDIQRIPRGEHKDNNQCSLGE